jgi:hypothetical protein
VRASNLVDQLEARDISWRAYMEGMPHPCYAGAEAGGYAKKHDPYLYYADIASNHARCQQIVPYTQLAADLREGSLPTFGWITPNLCDDGHNCDLGDVDRFLRGVVPALLTELGPKGALFITWDEGVSDQGCCGGQAAGGRIVTIVAGPAAQPGATVAIPYDPYSLLATVEQMLRLPRLRRAGSTHTKPLDALFRGGRAPVIVGGG